MNDVDKRSTEETQALQSNLAWYKSSESMSDGHCVEVARSGQYVLMRHSKEVSGPVLKFDTNEWNSFIQELKVRPMP